MYGLQYMAPAYYKSRKRKLLYNRLREQWTFSTAFYCGQFHILIHFLMDVWCLRRNNFQFYLVSLTDLLINVLLRTYAQSSRAFFTSENVMNLGTVAQIGVRKKCVANNKFERSIQNENVAMLTKVRYVQLQWQHI